MWCFEQALAHVALAHVALAHVGLMIVLMTVSPEVEVENICCLSSVFEKVICDLET